MSKEKAIAGIKQFSRWFRATLSLLAVVGIGLLAWLQDLEHQAYREALLDGYAIAESEPLAVAETSQLARGLLVFDLRPVKGETLYFELDFKSPDSEDTLDYVGPLQYRPAGTTEVWRDAVGGSSKGSIAPGGRPRVGALFEASVERLEVGIRIGGAIDDAAVARILLSREVPEGFEYNLNPALITCLALTVAALALLGRLL